MSEAKREPLFHISKRTDISCQKALLIRVIAIALALGVVLGSVVALVRVAHDQQRPGRRNPVLGFFNAVCQVYTTIIRGTPMMVQLLIMSCLLYTSPSPRD